MVINVGINGFGRVGRIVFRTCLQHPELEITAINDPAVDVDYICYLIKFDSTHGRLKVAVTQKGNEIHVDGRAIKVFHQKQTCTIPWITAGVEYVIEASGMFSTVEKASGHLTNSEVKRVLLTAPSVDVPMLVLGVNEEIATPEMKVLSCGSSTLYCLAPIIKILVDNFGVEDGFVTSIHAMTPSLKPLDGLCLGGKHWREHRSITQNIIPATTGACKALGKIIPQVRDKMMGLAFRVPIVNVSVLDITIRLNTNTTLEAIVQAIDKASNSTMQNLIRTSKEENVSSDFVGDTCSCILDANSSLQLKRDYFKLVCWYENEYSYACRVVESILFSEKQFYQCKVPGKMTYMCIPHLRVCLNPDTRQQTDSCSKDTLECEHPEILINDECTEITNPGAMTLKAAVESEANENDQSVIQIENNCCNADPKTKINIVEAPAFRIKTNIEPLGCTNTQERLEKVKREFYKMVDMTEGLLKKTNSSKYKLLTCTTDIAKENFTSSTDSNVGNKRETSVTIDNSSNQNLLICEIEQPSKDTDSNSNWTTINTANNRNFNELGGKEIVTSISYAEESVCSVIEIKNPENSSNLLNVRCQVRQQLEEKEERIDLDTVQNHESIVKDIKLDDSNSFEAVDKKIELRKESSNGEVMNFNGFSPLDISNVERQQLTMYDNIPKPTLHLKGSKQDSENQDSEQSQVQTNYEVNSKQMLELKQLNEDSEKFGVDRKVNSGRLLTKTETTQNYLHIESVIEVPKSSEDTRTLNSEYAPAVPERKVILERKKLEETHMLTSYSLQKQTNRKSLETTLQSTSKNHFTAEEQLNELREKRDNLQTLSSQRYNHHDKERLRATSETKPTNQKNFKTHVSKTLCSILDGISKNFQSFSREKLQKEDMSDKKVSKKNVNNALTPSNTKSVVGNRWKLPVGINSKNDVHGRFRNLDNKLEQENKCSPNAINVISPQSKSTDILKATDNVTNEEDQTEDNKLILKTSSKSLSLKDLHGLDTKYDERSKASLSSDVISEVANGEEDAEIIAKPTPEKSLKNRSLKIIQKKQLHQNQNRSQPFTGNENSKIAYGARDKIKKYMISTKTTYEALKLKRVHFECEAENDEELRKRYIELVQEASKTITYKTSQVSESSKSAIEGEYPQDEYASFSDPNNPAAPSRWTSPEKPYQPDIYDKLESASASDSENSMGMGGRKSEIIQIKDVTGSLDDLERLDKICRIIEISDDLSDMLFSNLNSAADTKINTSRKWSFKDLCEKIKLDEFCNNVFGK